jgi:transposase
VAGSLSRDLSRQLAGLDRFPAMLGLEEFTCHLSAHPGPVSRSDRGIGRPSDGGVERRDAPRRASQIPDMGPNRVPFRKWRNYMSERRKSFSSEFKDEAVKMVIESSRAVADVARELGIGAETLRTWVNRYRVEHADEEPPLTISERARLRELEKENRELKMKAEFLGKAAAFFAQEYR